MKPGSPPRRLLKLPLNTKGHPRSVLSVRTHVEQHIASRAGRNSPGVGERGSRKAREREDYVLGYV